MENEQQSLIQMHLDYDGGNILRETVRWSRFLAIVGIIALCIYLLLFLLAGAVIASLFSKFAPGLEQLEGLAGGILIAILLVFFGVFGVLVYMLYRFSSRTRKAIEQQDQAAFADGMKCLKVYFIILGIFGVLTLLGNLLSLITVF
ncbi:MAG TPA: hypothetical protein VHE54_05305 [Puia sp.]|nr:hypothetical protein [Puia sp.]